MSHPMFGQEPLIPTTTLCFEGQKVQVMGRFMHETLMLTTEDDPITNLLTAKLSAYVLTREVHRGTDAHLFRTPATWWQHLKADHFPQWYKRRWPVRYTDTEVKFDYRLVHAYPQADIAVPPSFGKSTRLVEVLVSENVSHA